MKHIVILGGGIGGLFTGAILSHEGCRVTVLEKNAIIGGGLQCFKHRGFSFETGMHILGGFMPGDTLDRICRYLGILERLDIRHTDADAIDSITYGYSGKTYHLPRGKEAFTSYLVQQFPHEADNLCRYMDAIYALSQEIDLFYLRRSSGNVLSHSEQFFMPVDEFIASYINDPHLRELLAYMSPMYGGVAGHTPAYIHAVINVLYINGSSQFVDGSQQLADALASVIRQGGGDVIAGDAVTHVEVADREVKCVITASGKHYMADCYISSLHPSTLFCLTDEGAFPRSYRNRVSSIPNSYSAFTVYIKFKPLSQPYVNHPRYFQREYDTIWQLADYDEATFPKAFMYLTPPTHDQGPWASRMLVNCIMPYDAVRRWQDTRVGHRGAEYEDWKERHKQAVLAQLEKLHPGFIQSIDFSFASSPLTIRDYYGVKDGSLYGHQCDAQNLMLSQLPIVTKVHNLLLTGQNINLHGICGVPLTAIETAEVILGKGQVIDKISLSNS